MASIYNRDEIKKRIFVSPLVEAELKANIENQLNKCGIFCRVFSRTKSIASLEHKFATGKYGGEDDKKIQDLVGIRVNLYFQDDLDICKELFESIYEIVADKKIDVKSEEVYNKWSVNDASNDNFAATKINGVFKLPEYLINEVSDDTWEMAVDKTFEIQLRTVFFEGWHEVEHDFRYKFNTYNNGVRYNIWDEYSSYSRQLNSVVATLELCDNSVVTMLENFAHQLYKDKKWDMMLRMHYRIRISDQPLYDGIAQILEADESKLGKALFKTKRKVLIEELKTLYRNVPISVNMIIAILNKKVLGDNQQIRQIMEENDVFGYKNSNTEREMVFGTLSPLKGYCLFKNKVLVKCRDKTTYTKIQLYNKLCWKVYGWMKGKFGNIFADMPEQLGDYQNSEMGYDVEFKMDRDANYMKMCTSHIGQEVGGRIWKTEVELWGDEQQKGIWMSVNNTLYTKENVSELDQVSRFSYPRLYSSILGDEELEIYDVRKYGKKVGVISDEAIRGLSELIESVDRQTPVVVMASNNREDDDRILDEEWIGNNWLYKLHGRVKYYAHIYRCSVDVLGKLMEEIKGDRDQVFDFGLYVFWPRHLLGVGNWDDNYDFYSRETIDKCKYSRYKGAGAGIRVDKVPDGSKSFMFFLEDKIKACVVREQHIAENEP